MKWIGSKPKQRIIGLILAGLATWGMSESGNAQELKDEFAQEWISFGDEDTAVELVDHHSSGTLGCDGCAVGCDGCCPPIECCPPWWAHRSGVMGEFLFLRPGNTDVVYTIEQNNVPADQFPTGPVGLTAIEHSEGIRAGFSCCASARTSLIGSVTYWEGDDADLIDATAGNILVSEILHPSRLNTGATGLQEAASYDMRFGLADLAYRHLWCCGPSHAVNWRAGFQYAGMEQEFQWTQTVPSSVAIGTFAVDTDIDFSGFGLLGGLDFERRSCKTGLSCYGSAIGSAVAGKWKASYRDVAQLAGGSVGNVYDDFRVTPILELELGLAWSSECGRVRANVGYLSSAWYNSVSSRAYIDAVREGRFIDIDETITFSGLVVGGEYRF